MLSDHVCNIVKSSVVKTKESLFPILQINLSIAQKKKIWTSRNKEMENQTMWCKADITETSCIPFRTFLLINLKNKSIC